MVSNALGTTISSPAMLEVIPLDGAPLVLLEPEDQLGWPSADASFRVLAGGAPPLVFQWQFNGTNLPGATNSTLDLVNLSVADIGYYRARISNLLGETLSAPAFLGVLDYSAALNSPGLVFGTSLESMWEVDPWITHDGELAARAGGRTGYPASRLQTSVTGPGYATFWWKADPSGRNLVFRMDDDGEPIYYAAGEWQQRGINIPAGGHFLAWWCESEAWLDQVEFVPGTNLPPLITLPPTAKAACREGRVTFDVEAVGTPPLRYQWQFSSTNIAAATNQSLSLSQVLPEHAGLYRVIVSNDYGTSTSTVAQLHALPLAYWGMANSRMTEFPPSLTNTVALSANGYHCLALKADGTVVAWGETENDQCRVPPGLSNVIAISVGYSVSLALTADGRVTAWGQRSVTNVPANLTRVVAIAAGSCHALALQADGTVVGWGYESPDQIRVPAGLTNAVAIAAGHMHSAALKADGTVITWGSTDPANNPPPDLTNAIALAVGYMHSLALRTDGQVVAWGNNFAGQTDVPPGLTNVVAIAAGYASSLALCADGTVVGWGDNSYGQINGPCEPRAITLAAGWHHGLSLLGTPAPPSHVLPLALKGTSFKLALPTERGKIYRLEYKNSLADRQWILLAPQSGDGTVQILADPGANVPRRFYRVYRQP
jgi:hypothetical protein